MNMPPANANALSTTIAPAKTGQKDPAREPGEKPWTQSHDLMLAKLKVDPVTGLSSSEVLARRAKYGMNRLEEKKEKSAWSILVYQFKSALVALLMVAAIASFAFHEYLEGTAIIIVVVINAIIGFITESRATRSMEALYSMTKVSTNVLREKQVQNILAEELVPSDIIVLDAGDVVSADCRVIEASKLKVDESTFTGESMPVEKRMEPVAADTVLAERYCMLYNGTAVTRGNARGLVVATGKNTELGKIAKSVEQADEEITPLEERLTKLGQKLVWLLMGIVVVVVISGILRGQDLLLMIETAIALAVAAVPEGLPIVATIALARGMLRMAKRNVLVSRLSAVETLGSTSVICTDKTGTLTENRMTVTYVETPHEGINITGSGLSLEGTFNNANGTIDPSAQRALDEVIQVSTLCNNAALRATEKGVSFVGDPMEAALLIMGRKAGVVRDELVASMPEVKEEAFDSILKMMATYHSINPKIDEDGAINKIGKSGNVLEEEEEEYLVAVKGAPESVLKACATLAGKNGTQKMGEQERAGLMKRNNELATDGLRILAIASKQASSLSEKPYENLNFLGFVGMLDPPRPEAKDAIHAFREAGIRVIMLTGDQIPTARNVGLSVGLIENEDESVLHGREIRPPDELDRTGREKLLTTNIFARVDPAQKLNLIELHQRNGAIVAMTGDGVNDAPALKKADIGVAMGQRGTQVAVEASDMVLQDDNFSSIVMAVEYGRTIFANIRSFVYYLLSCNISELMVILIATLLGTILPLLPLQILFLNLVTDIFPAFALGVNRGSMDTMRRPPRGSDEAIITKRHWLGIAGYGLTITFSVLFAFILALGPLEMGDQRAVTIAFLTLAFAQLWHVFNMRDPGTKFFKNRVTTNKYVWVALGICVFLLMAATYAPGLSLALNTVDPGLNGWALILGASLVPWVVGQVYCSFAKPE